jgi:hypothetical protein
LLKAKLAIKTHYFCLFFVENCLLIVIFNETN